MQAHMDAIFGPEAQDTKPHPLFDGGARLLMLEITHPEAETLTTLLSPRLSDPRIVFTSGPAKAMQASFTTPHGTRSFP